MARFPESKFSLSL
jgi:hypothetical protein